MHAHVAHETCPHCGTSGQIRRPSVAFRFALVPAWITVGAMVLGAGMIGPFVLVVVLPLFAGGVGLLSWLHAQASEPPTCEACGKIAIPAGAEVVAVGDLGAHAPVARAA